jgi:hypothetical protein
LEKNKKKGTEDERTTSETPEPGGYQERFKELGATAAEPTQVRLFFMLFSFILCRPSKTFVI